MLDSLAAILEHAHRLIGGALLLAGGAGLAVTVRERTHARASLGWPSVVGRVVRSRPSYVAFGGRTADDLGASAPTHHLVVEYVYVVDGREYAGARTRFGDEPAGS